MTKYPIRMRRVGTNLDVLLGVTKFICRGCLCLSCDKIVRAPTFCKDCGIRKEQRFADKRIERLCFEYIVIGCAHYEREIPDEEYAGTLDDDMEE
jgi:hypothetical protein